MAVVEVEAIPIIKKVFFLLYLSLKSPFKSPVFLRKVSCIFPSNLL